MALEVATYINQLNPANPVGTDPLTQADDHFRLIKTVIKNTFPNIDGPVTLTDDQINALETRVDSLEVGGVGGGGTTVGITTVATLPATGSFTGETVYLSTDNRLYSWSGTAWVPLTQANITPDTPAAIEVVSSLPATATDGDVIFNTTDNKLYNRVNGVWQEVTVTVTAAQDVADASITVAKFAQGIRPIEIVATLPTTGNSEGRLVYLTTDDKIYRYTGVAWTSGVATGDLTGTITGNQISANTITSGLIQAGAIGADQIAAGAISAVKIAAGTITADKLTAGSITADSIATNAITSDKIATNSITSGKIAAAAIGATQIATGAITAGSGIISNAAVGTLQIAGNAVLVPSSLTRSDTVEATGTFSTTTPTQVMSLQIYVPFACTLAIFYQAKQDFAGWNEIVGYGADPTAPNGNFKGFLSTETQLLVNGVVVRTQGSGTVENVVAINHSIPLSGGTHTVSITWRGQRFDANARVNLIERNLTLLGAMR